MKKRISVATFLDVNMEIMPYDLDTYQGWHGRLLFRLGVWLIEHAPHKKGYRFPSKLKLPKHPNGSKN